MWISRTKYDSVEYLKILIQWLVIETENKCLKTKIFVVFFFSSVHIAYKHNSPQLIKSINVHPLAIVTAAVDRIGSRNLFSFRRISTWNFAEVAIPHMDMSRNVRLSGYASNVGKSSMEVTLKIDQVRSDINQDKIRICLFLIG